MFAVTRDLQFGNLKVTVKELTVAEVRAWLNEPTPADEPEFDILTGLMSFDGSGDQGVELGFFQRVPRQAQRGASTSRTLLDARSLERSVATLVRAGHASAWTYPWAVFVSSCDEYEAYCKAMSKS